MSIILIGGEKGGTGKTTLAVNLAARRALQGRDVLVIDTDIQASASYWAQTRDETAVTPRVACIQKFGKGLQTEVRDLATRYQDLVIDAGGRDSVELRSLWWWPTGSTSRSSPRSSTSGRWGGWTIW